MSNINFMRYMALQYDRVENHRRYLEDVNGINITIDESMNSWIMDDNLPQEWESLYRENKDEFTNLCDRTCGEKSCRGIGQCLLSDELVHHIEYGINQKVQDVE